MINHNQLIDLIHDEMGLRSYVSCDEIASIFLYELGPETNKDIADKLRRLAVALEGAE